MKKIVMVLGVVGIVVGMMVLAVSVFGSAFASQIMGTPLYTDPGAHERIMSSPRPERFSFGRALPRFPRDLEVEWRPIGDPDFHRSIRGIFVDRDGALRVVDIHPRAMQGMRLWRSDDGGKNWRVERETGNAWADRGASLVGKEKGEVLFSRSHSDQPRFEEWPLEVETLIKTEFRGLYEQRAKRWSSVRRVFLAKAPDNPKIMVFCSLRATGAPTGQSQTIVRLFVTIDGGENWIEISPPNQSAMGRGAKSVYVGGLAIKKETDTIRIFVGQRGDFEKMVQSTIIDLSELEEVLIAEE